MDEKQVDWDDLLPQRRWRHFDTKTWEQYMPPPSLQHSELLPQGWGGSCAAHSLSEAMTANLRSSFGIDDIQVDLPRLLHLAIAKGFLTAQGASLQDLNHLVASYGLPLDGSISQLHGDHRYRLFDHDADAYALGTSVHAFRATAMPFADPSYEVAEKAMRYRENICDMLDFSPVVLCYGLQKHYDLARAADEPYRRLAGDHHYVREEVPNWLGLVFDGPVINHCVTACGYECPEGDVRSLRLKYQENMKDAPGAHPGRHLIHPDAVDYYYFPYTLDVSLSNTPSEGHESVEHLAQQSSVWEVIRRRLF